jgi:hypothetical protein
MSEPEPMLSLRRVAHPSDANHQGTVFGGFILSLIDEAAYLEVRRHGVHRWRQGGDVVWVRPQVLRGQRDNAACRTTSTQQKTLHRHTPPHHTDAALRCLLLSNDNKHTW